MAVPALVIGLGGTGQWVLTYLKKSLLETYDRIPTEVRLRSFDTVKVSRTQTGERAATEQHQRVEERSVAGVKLEAGEYIHIGGYVRDYVRDIAQDDENKQFSHIRSWYQAKYYLDNLPDAQFQLDEGAGQFRQFGRIAVFHDLKAATVSLIYGQLQDTVQQIQRDTNTQNLQVFVIGSLAGGTGAGMFVDIAHLVRQIAQQQAHMQVKVRGFLVLPDAFGSIPAGNVVKRGMNARAFAAMRENKRFTASFDWDLGYPMHYQASTIGRQPDPVLQGALKGQLFDQLYYIDGHRERFPLFSIPLEQGVAPSIADMVVAILDERSSGAFQEHTTNLQAVLASRGPTRGIPYYGSLGAYSIIFPIYHVIEGYAHRLGLEVLQQLLKPAGADDRTGLPTHLAGDQNQEVGAGYTGANAARDLLTSSSMIDPRDPTKSVDNSLLAPELVDIADRYAAKDTTIVDALAGRSLGEWDRFFAPTGQAEDVVNARNRAEVVLSVDLFDEVPPSRDVTPREKPVDGIYRIENGVRAHKNLYLGAEQADTGQRIGGKYREALNEYTQVHLSRFRRMLEYKTLEILNGRSANEPLNAKGGKLGHYREFLMTLSNYLDNAYQVMTRVMERRRSQGYGRQQAIAAAQNALTDMKDRATDTRPFIGRAHSTQETYLELEQSLIDIHKVEIMEQAVADTIKQMADWITMARSNTDAWIATLATGSSSIYATLLEGKRQVDANRDKDADVESRLVLGARKGGREEDEDYSKFKRYEEERYQRYVYGEQVNQVAAILSDFNWQVTTEMQVGKPVFQLKLTVGTDDVNQPQRAETNPVRRGSTLLLTRARAVFESMKCNESVLGYLTYAYSAPETLAETIHARSGPLLAHDGAGPVPANYLRIWHGQEQGQSDFLRAMLRRLAGLSNISDADRFARLVNSEDRFSCTLVHTIDLIELDRISTYQNARREYLGYQGEQGLQTSQRTILHLFPAEVNAVQFEERLIELNQSARMFSDNIVLQLEKLDNLRLFLFCYAYDLIIHESDDASGQTREYISLSWDPVNERDSGEAWLTKASADVEPSILEALTTFNYVGKDVGHGEDYHKPIDYEAVRRSLGDRQLAVMQERRAANTLGQSDPALQAWLQDQELPDDHPIWIWVGRHDRLAEEEKTWSALLPEVATDLRTNSSLQSDYDLMSVFVLVLRDEMAKLHRRIRNIAPADMPQETKSPKPEGKKRTSIWRR